MERVPVGIRAAGGIARMADPNIILRIMEAVTIPVMAQCRIGHFVEAQILEAHGVDYIGNEVIGIIDEWDVLTAIEKGDENAASLNLFKLAAAYSLKCNTCCTSCLLIFYVAESNPLT